MDLFTQVEDGVAIVRAPNGVFKQTKVFTRAGRVYVPHAGGFIRVCAAFNSMHTTSHPSIKVVEMEAPGLDTIKGEPTIRAGLKVAA